MPPPTSSLKPAAAGKANGSSKPEVKTAAAAPAKTAGDSGEKRTTVAKPDKAAYDAEQDAANKEIADIKTKLVS